MKISIRKSKHQEGKITIGQAKFAFACVTQYIELGYNTYWNYEGNSDGESVACDVYKTKTTTSAIVRFIKQ
jgi:hypothetical protein